MAGLFGFIALVWLVACIGLLFLRLIWMIPVIGKPLAIMLPVVFVISSGMTCYGFQQAKKNNAGPAEVYVEDLRQVCQNFAKNLSKVDVRVQNEVRSFIPKDMTQCEIAPYGEKATVKIPVEVMSIGAKSYSRILELHFVRSEQHWMLDNAGIRIDAAYLPEPLSDDNWEMQLIRKALKGP